MLELSAVERHYTRGNLAERILEGLHKSGKDNGRPRPEDLAAVDQFHIRGRAATLELAKVAGIQPGWSVLDVGGGIGGAARLLASRLRCQVTVLDLTDEFVRTGAMLCERMDLAGLVHFRHGSALDMPFDRERFDVVWTQHSTMNIANKDRLYDEAHRVLRPRGRLAMHEVVAGPVEPACYPVPWAVDESTSFLLPQAQLRTLIARFGFRELAWQDTTAASLEWFKRVALPPLPQASPPPLGLHLLLGDTAAAMLRGQALNLEERRLEVVQAVFERP
ncbi:MAG TPA: methyltransferase domain-containing protein [Chloroflexota bacterium]|nr:methyltransferase domain-containing protein [Chloroflexota bacterium]